MTSPARMAHKLRHWATRSRARPRATQDREMVLRWFSLEETNPDPKRLGKYPTEIKRKKDPAWLWVMFRSCSMVGMRGARMIREMKFRKKMAARKRRGPS